MHPGEYHTSKIAGLGRIHRYTRLQGTESVRTHAIDKQYVIKAPINAIHYVHHACMIIDCPISAKMSYSLSVLSAYRFFAPAPRHV